jgi:SpoVK/Ycf46/Vps4 family AAA+-type ATPase
MPSIRHLAKLFASIGSRDFQSADEAAAAIISAEAQKGHTGAARTLKAALKSNEIRGYRAPEPVTAVLRGDSFLASALSAKRQAVRLDDVRLRRETKTSLQEVIEETRHKGLLVAKGIRPRSKLMFVGPPGCGKSVTANALANELNLPFYTVRFDSIIGAYLGQTASRLRELFQFSAGTPCVLLFDEVDALGRQRGSAQDVGELDRIVIALMQELDMFDSPGLLIATSNLPKSIDNALWRRFDSVMTFPPPSKKELQSYARTLSTRYDIGITGATKLSLPKARSYAEAEQLVESLARKAALKGIADG